MSHTPVLRRTQALTCCCCGSETRGRQWFNRDKGFGLCPKCAAWISQTEDAESMRENYGVPGIHHSLTPAP